MLTGFVVDIAISALLSLLATPQFYTAPNLAQPGDLLLIGLLALSTGIGGFVAGRMAGESRTIGSWGVWAKNTVPSAAKASANTTSLNFFVFSVFFLRKTAL